MKRLLLSCMVIACHLNGAESYKPFHVLSLSGTASLTRFEDEAWPLENGQDLPGDFALKLQAGAFIHLRVNRRVDLSVAGPADFRSYVMDQGEGEHEGPNVVLRMTRGDYLIDTRFLLSHPCRIHLDLPDANFELQGGTCTALSVDPARLTQFSTQSEILQALAASPVPVLVLARDYDKELNAWARPAILGPALMATLKNLPSMVLVDGSGDTSLAAYANSALRTGKDFFLQDLGTQRGARFVIAGNLVSEEQHEDSISRRPIISASAEIRVLESDAGGDVVISDVASTATARAGRSLEIVDSKVMHAAADKAALYMVDDMAGLLMGQSHPPLLLKVSFNGVSVAWMHELRQGLGGLPSVQRFFKRGFSSGVFRVDVILRRSQEEFLDQLKAWAFRGFMLEQDQDLQNENFIFTLRKAPSPAMDGSGNSKAAAH